MKNLHKPSGITVATAVYLYEEIRKYSPGFILINSEGMKTKRFAPDPTMYSNEKEAEEISFKFGRIGLADHLNGNEKLDFDQK